MGIAIIWVLLFHSDIQGSIGLNFMKEIGYGGVDIFLFASGIGCFHSLEKNDNFLEFMRRRVLRILPSYFIYLAVWIPYELIFFDIKFSEIIGNILCIGWWANQDNQLNWYMDAIWVMYLLAPYLYNVVRTSKMKNNILLLFFLIGLGIPFFGQDILMAIARIPIFALGVYFARYTQNKKMGQKTILGIFVCSLLGLVLLYILVNSYYNYLWAYGLWWYPFILITPGCVIFISCILNILEKKRSSLLVHTLTKIGESSLEIYLINVVGIDIFRKLSTMGFYKNSNITWIIFIIFNLLVGYLLYAFTQKIKGYLRV